MGNHKKQRIKNHCDNNLDQSTYETFVHMAQPFTNNIPAVDFHGSCGNQVLGGDAFANQRYTECRLSKIAEDGMLCGIDKNTVDMVLNYSDDEYMPTVLPGLFPYLLVNGCKGIGVSIANCHIPHNFNETIELILDYLSTGVFHDEQYFPDFPTGGRIITDKNDLVRINKTGKGKVVCEAVYTIAGNEINFTEFPYQTNIGDIQEEIAEFVDKTKFSAIVSFNNKSDKDNLCLNVKVDKGVDPNEVIDILFKNTSLKKQYDVNQVAIVGKTPRLMSTKEIVDKYLEHTIDCLKKECVFDREKMRVNIDKLTAILRAIDNIDAVINIVRNSSTYDESIDTLVSELSFSKEQARVVLDMKISRLNKLNKNEIEKNIKECRETLDRANKILSSDKEQKKVIVKRLKVLLKNFSSERKSIIGKRENIVKINTIAKKYAVHIKNDVSGVYLYKNDGDEYEDSDVVLVLSSKGKFYRISIDDIPFNKFKKDIPVSENSLVSLDNGEHLMYICNKKESLYVIATKNGKIKKGSISEFFGTVRNLNGISAIKLAENDSVIATFLLDDDDCCIVTDYINGKTANRSYCPLYLVPLQKKSSSGVINVKYNNSLVINEVAIVPHKGVDIDKQNGVKWTGKRQTIRYKQI